MEGDNIDEAQPLKRSADIRLVGGIWEMLRRGLSKKIGKYNDQLEFVIKVHAIFDGFDEDGSGTISPMELRRALRHMGIPVSAKEILEISQRYASDTDRIKYEEFEELVKDLIPPPEFDIGGIVLEQKLMAMFKEMDSNGDLTLSPEELRRGLSKLDLTISEQHLSKILAVADKDKSGAIDFHEFCGLYSRTPLGSGRSAAEADAAARRFAIPERPVRGADRACRAGVQVMIRGSESARQGFRRYGGVGVLTRPADDAGRRWFAKFPCAAETLFSTGSSDVCELMYAREDSAAAPMLRRRQQERVKFTPDERGSSGGGGSGGGDEGDEGDEAAALLAFRRRLILARQTALGDALTPRVGPRPTR